jgi:hypothetical protein
MFYRNFVWTTNFPADVRLKIEVWYISLSMNKMHDYVLRTSGVDQSSVSIWCMGFFLVVVSLYFSSRKVLSIQCLILICRFFCQAQLRRDNMDNILVLLDGREVLEIMMCPFQVRCRQNKCHMLCVSIHENFP